MSPAYVWPSTTGLTTPDQRTYTLCGRCGTELSQPRTDPDRVCRDCYLVLRTEREDAAREHRDQQIADLVRQGYTTAQVADNLGVSMNVVRKTRRRLGIPGKHGGQRPHRKEGTTP